MEKEKCKKRNGEGKHRDGSTCKWCGGSGEHTPSKKDDE